MKGTSIRSKEEKVKKGMREAENTILPHLGSIISQKMMPP